MELQLPLMSWSLDLVIILDQDKMEKNMLQVAKI